MKMESHKTPKHERGTLLQHNVLPICFRGITLCLQESFPLKFLEDQKDDLVCKPGLCEVGNLQT